MNRMSKLQAAAASGLAAILLFASPAPAADPDAARGGRLGELMHCLSVIGLSDAQKAEVRAVLEAEKPIVEGLLQQLKTDHDALEAALAANPPNGCDVGTAFLKVHADGEALKAEFAKIKSSIGAILTADQRARLEGCLAGKTPPRSGSATLDSGTDD